MVIKVTKSNYSHGPDERMGIIEALWWSNYERKYHCFISSTNTRKKWMTRMEAHLHSITFTGVQKHVHVLHHKHIQLYPQGTKRASSIKKANENFHSLSTYFNRSEEWYTLYSYKTPISVEKHHTHYIS
jgi:hypothetical protein